MALRNQPYLPLYVQDFLTDEKLSECSAESTGVYIRMMCLMHKSDDYGTILLKQKDKQTCGQISDFAVKLARQMPYDSDTIERALTELIEEKVISIDGDLLYQKRMVHDGKLSDIRASSGSKGGKKSKEARQFASDFAQAKPKANAEYEYEIENEPETKDENTDKENVTSRARMTADTVSDVIDYLNSCAATKYRPSSQNAKKYIGARLKDGFELADFKAVVDKKCAEWLNTEWEKFLRPETLFGTKFESYLNQRTREAPRGASDIMAEMYAEIKAAEEAEAYETE